MATGKRPNKSKLLRNNEYYDIQKLLDGLYNKSLKGYNFYKITEMVKNPQNIRLAYRNIKRNKGSKTKGVDNTTIEDVANLETDKYIKHIQNKIDNYIPMPVRRKNIPKGNGKTRPLGIPAMEDRLVQQCVKQILEPICEAKFHKHSYGFRPNRSTHHAIARANYLINRVKTHYVVDIDIKGFFDNINHGKLLKQMWSLGIRDKRIISIISKMLKAKIMQEGKQTKGSPQGSIISPLLSNIVLNELDWWVSSQWETFNTHHEYSSVSGKYRALKTTDLKEIYIVRYADDFKIFCKDHKTAQKVFVAVKKWLKERLDLEISPEKSKVVNLRKNYSKFLGFKLKARKKADKWVLESHIEDEKLEKVKEKLRQRIKEIKKEPTQSNRVRKLNSTILGIQNYYKVATHVNIDLKKIHFNMTRYLYNQLKNNITNKGKKSKIYERLYGKYNLYTYYVNGICIFPIAGIKTQTAYSFVQDICNYTLEGRELKHTKLRGVSTRILRHIMEKQDGKNSVEYNDNQLSRYVGQSGKCGISKRYLQKKDMHCHHIIPKEMGGTDEYKNLLWLTTGIHRLIHATRQETISKYLDKERLNKEQIKALNKYRVKVGNCVIE